MKGTQNVKTRFTKLTVAFGVLVLVARAALAQSGTVQTSGATVATTVPPPSPAESLPRPDFRFKGQVGRTYEDSGPPTFPQVVRPPKGAPNVLLILIDDAGFGQFSTFGGGVPSPNIDKLATQGLRYTRFHTTALCSPTRAALLTGRDHHVAATGVITELTTGYDGYTGIIPKSTGTVSEILRQNGYATAWIGKNHNTPPWETSEVGPFDHWPSGLGFDYFYGFNSGDTSQFEPILFENHNRIPRSTDPNYHISHDLADRAIAWMRREKEIDPARPFFLYVAPSATHSPHMAPKEWIDKFKGQFDIGWDKYREETYQRQLKLGVIPPDAKLTPRAKSLPAWDSLNADQKRLYTRMMEIFAGFSAQIDYEMGRVLDAAAALPDADNTLIFYILGDNGASAEGGLDGSTNEIAGFNGVLEDWQSSIKHIDELGGPKYYNHFPAGWAWAMDAPFQWTKQIASHFGGTRNPLVISWPARIKKKGGQRMQFHHHGRDADYSRSRRHPRARLTQRRPSEADRRRQHGLHFQRRKGAGAPEITNLRIGFESCNVPERMDGILHRLPALGGGADGLRSRQGEMGTLPYRPGFLSGQRLGGDGTGQAQGTG
jgi:arylsulfatase A-like enzyme